MINLYMHCLHNTSKLKTISALKCTFYTVWKITRLRMYQYDTIAKSNYSEQLNKAIYLIQSTVKLNQEIALILFHIVEWSSFEHRVTLVIAAGL